MAICSTSVHTVAFPYKRRKKLAESRKVMGRFQLFISDLEKSGATVTRVGRPRSWRQIRAGCPSKSWIYICEREMENWGMEARSAVRPRPVNVILILMTERLKQEVRLTLFNPAATWKRWQEAKHLH